MKNPTRSKTKHERRSCSLRFPRKGKTLSGRSLESIGNGGPREMAASCEGSAERCVSEQKTEFGLQARIVHLFPQKDTFTI